MPAQNPYRYLPWLTALALLVALVLVLGRDKKDPHCVQDLEAVYANTRGIEHSLHLWGPDDIPRCKLPEGPRRSLFVLSGRCMHGYYKTRFQAFMANFPQGDAQAWRRACPAGSRVLDDTRLMPPMFRAREIYRRCDLARLDMMDVETFVSRPDRAYDVLPFYTWMLDVGLAPDKARALALRLMESPSLTPPTGLDVISPPHTNHLFEHTYTPTPTLALSLTRGRMNGYLFADVDLTRDEPLQLLHDRDTLHKDIAAFNKAMEGWSGGGLINIRADRRLPYKALSSVAQLPLERPLQLLAVRQERFNGNLVDADHTALPFFFAFPDGRGAYMNMDPGPVVRVAIGSHGFHLTIDGESRVRWLGRLSGEADCIQDEPKGCYPFTQLYNAIQTGTTHLNRLQFVVAPGPDIPVGVVLSTVATLLLDSPGPVSSLELARYARRHPTRLHLRNVWLEVVP